MKELRIDLKVVDGKPHVALACKTGDQSPWQHWERPFIYQVPQALLDQWPWYWSEYACHPWDTQDGRAIQLERSQEQAGSDLFKALFDESEAASLYSQVADDLSALCVTIHHGGDEAGFKIPWELIRDPSRGDYGWLARSTHAFFRSLSSKSAPDQLIEDRSLKVVFVPGISHPDATADPSLMLSMMELMRDHKDRLEVKIPRGDVITSLQEVRTARGNQLHVVHLECSVVEGADHKRQLVIQGIDGKSSCSINDFVRVARPVLVLLDCIDASPRAMWSDFSVALNDWIGEETPVVVALPPGLSRSARLVYWSRLYERLLNGEDVSSAATAARNELWNYPLRTSATGEVAIRDWMAPIVYANGTLRFGAAGLPCVRFKPVSTVARQTKAANEMDAPELPVLGLVGRDHDVLRMECLLQKHTTVLIEGIFGVGRTELAMAWVRWHAELDRFMGPVLFFRFQNHVPPMQVYDRISQLFQEEIRALYQRDVPQLDAIERRQTVIELLRNTPCVMVWAHFEMVAGFPPGIPSAWPDAEQKELRDFLAALEGGKTRIVITSRQDEPWLGPGYGRLPLAGLRIHDAQLLAVQAMRRAGMSLRLIKDLKDHTNLLAFVRGNPLGIQIMAPELRRQDAIALLGTLMAGESDCGEARAFDLLVKHRFDSLDAAFRRRLAILGIFEGFVSARVLAAMSAHEAAPAWLRDLTREDWVRLLDVAGELGLLRRVNEGAFAIHIALQNSYLGLMRDFYADHMDWLEHTFCLIVGRMGNQLFQVFQANAEFAVSLLSAEQDNLVKACRLARRRRDWDCLKEILCGLRTLLISTGRWSEWEALIADLEADMASLAPERDRNAEILWFRLVGHRAELCEYRRDFSGLRALHAGLGTMFPELSDNTMHEDVLDDLGAIAEAHQFIEEAERFYLKSLSLKQQAGDQAGQGNTLLRLADLAFKSRHYREAEQWLIQALDLAGQLGDEDKQATLCCRLGAVEQERGYFEDAEKYYEQSLAIRTELGDQPRKALALHQLGRMAHERKEYAMAAQRYLESLAIREKIGDVAGTSATLHQLGRMARDQKEFLKSTEFFQRALAIRVKLADEPGQAQTSHQLGNVAFLQNRLEEATAWYEKSLAIREKLRDVHGQARNLNQLGKIAQLNHDVPRAEACFSRAEALFKDLQNPLSGLRDGTKWVSS